MAGGKGLVRTDPAGPENGARFFKVVVRRGCGSMGPAGLKDGADKIGAMRAPRCPASASHSRRISGTEVTSQNSGFVTGPTA